MPWKETSPGRYERPFDSLERMYRAISAAGASLGREHFAITAVLRLRLNADIIIADDPTPMLRTAWKRLRYDFPHIAAYGLGDGTYVYEVPTTDEAVEAWLAETFIVEEDEEEEVRAEATPPGELARMHYFPRREEVMFRSSHWRIDGIGTLHLLNHFLGLLTRPRGEAAAAVRFGDEGEKNLCVGLDEAVGTVVVDDDDAMTPDIMEKAATDLLMRYVNNLPTIGLPARLGEVPRGSARRGIKLAPQLTSAIIARCKELSLSVTSAVHAAIVCATAKKAKPSDENPPRPTKYTSWSTFDVRRYLPAPYDGAANAVSIFHTGIPVVVANPAGGFLENAAQLGAIYGRDLMKDGGGGGPAAGGKNLFAFLPRYVDKVTGVLTRPPPPSPPTDPALSSLGVIDNYLDSRPHGDDGVEVVDFWLGVDMLSPQLMVYLWTRRGQMELSACYNVAFYEAGFVEEFLALVRGVLVEGLGIFE